MFLSSRWGKPSYEIESLPLGEFNRQKLFWEHCPWGGIDDIMALHHSSYIAIKSGKKPREVVEVKRLAAYTSAAKTFIVESVKSIRNTFMGIAESMKDR